MYVLFRRRRRRRRRRRQLDDDVRNERQLSNQPTANPARPPKRPTDVGSFVARVRLTKAICTFGERRTNGPIEAAAAATVSLSDRIM
jgi:hypothetical protein